MAEIRGYSAKELINLFRKPESDEGAKISSKESLEISKYLQGNPDLNAEDKSLLIQALAESNEVRNKENTSRSQDFNARYSDLNTNPRYTREKKEDRYGYQYQCIYDGDKLIGRIDRNSVRFYNDENGGEIYRLDGSYDCRFELQAKDADTDEYVEETHYYPDGTIEILDKHGNSVIYDKDGNEVEKTRTEMTDDGPVQITINRQEGLKRVLNSNVEGAVYDKEGNVVYNVYTYLDAAGRIDLQTREYPDGRVMTFSPQHKIVNLTLKDKESITSTYLAKVKEDVSNALAILKDYEAGKGILGSTAQLFMKDEATSEAKIQYYEELLSKLECLENLSQEKFEAEFKRLFGKEFNYSAAYTLNRSNENLILASNTLKSMAAIDSALELVLPEEETVSFFDKNSPFYNKAKSALDAIPKFPEKGFIAKAKDREFGIRDRKSVV